MAYDYDAQIERLTKKPELIYGEWVRGRGLFQFCTPTGYFGKRYLRCGCLTMVRGGDEQAYTPELTERIRADKRLPKDVDEIRPQHFPAMKEWQEELDRTIRAREKP